MLKHKLCAKFKCKKKGGGQIAAITKDARKKVLDVSKKKK